MSILLNVILLALAVLFSLLVGIVVGICDCKRRFNIPKGASGVDDNGYIYT